MQTCRIASFALCLAPIAASANGIEGTWINDVKIVACNSPQTVLAAFQSMFALFKGGEMVEAGSPATPPPAVSRSSGLGAWSREERNGYKFQFRSHSFDSIGQLVRITEVTSNVRLTQGDNPSTTDVVEPYYLAGWGTNRTSTVDPATGAVLAVTHGCNYAVSRPMLSD